MIGPRRIFLFLRAIFGGDKREVFLKDRLYPLSRIAEEAIDTAHEMITDEKGGEDDDYKHYVFKHCDHLAFL